MFERVGLEIYIVATIIIVATTRKLSKSYINLKMTQNPESIANKAKEIVLNLLPLKSRAIYHKEYDAFNEWKYKNGILVVNEDVMLNYIYEKSQTFKPSTVWSKYSMLKAVLSVKEDVHIDKFPKLIAFLEKNSAGYAPKKSKVLSREEIDQFLATASDETYLLSKLNIQLIVCFICSSKWKETKLTYATQFSWDLETLPLDTKNKIQHTWKQVDTGFMVGCGLTACSTIAVLREVKPALWNIVSALDFMEEYVPHFTWIAVADIWITSLYMTFMLVMAMYYWFVPTILTRIQLTMLYSMVDQFKESAPKQRSDKYVEENLKSITKRHQNILRIYGILKKNAFIPLFLITISLFISFSYNTIIFQSPYYGNVSPIITYIAALILAAYFSYQGQSLEDQYQDLFTSLYDLNWYEWNINNMKTFKTLFLNASVPLTVSDMALFRLNHSYFKESIKMVYTLINLARTIK